MSFIIRPTRGSCEYPPCTEIDEELKLLGEVICRLLQEEGTSSVTVWLRPTGGTENAPPRITLVLEILNSSCPREIGERVAVHLSEQKEWYQRGSALVFISN